VAQIGYSFPGGKITLAPAPSKTDDIEVKNKRKSAEETKAEHSR